MSIPKTQGAWKCTPRPATRRCPALDECHRQPCEQCHGECQQCHSDARRYQVFLGCEGGTVLTWAFDLMGIILKNRSGMKETAKSPKESLSGLTRDKPQNDPLKQISFSRLRATLQLSKLTAEAFWSRPWRYCRRPARQSSFEHRASHRVGDSSVVGGWCHFNSVNIE